MYTYKAYGLSIESPLEIPEFLVSSTTSPSVFFQFGKIPPPDVCESEMMRVILPFEEGILLYWREIGTFLVKKGREVTIDPKPEVDESLLRLVLTGPVLGVLLHQRGFHVFHSSVISEAHSRDAVAFVALKGGGKSTMASAMYNHGYRLMSDDIMAISESNGKTVVQPGFPHTKLWGESVEALVDDAQSLRELAPDADKRGRCVKEGFETQPTPLKILFVLEFGDEIQIRPISGKEALQSILPHWYGALFNGELLDLFGRKEHFLQCVNIVKSVPMYTLSRPKSFQVLPDVVNRVDNFIVNNIVT